MRATATFPPEGWRILTLVTSALAGLVAWALAAYGVTEDAVRSVVRVTARISLVLFLLAFTASSLQAFLRSGPSAWALRNRRTLGVSFAASHTLHLLALVALGLWFPDPFLVDLEALAVIGGGLAYVFLYAMTITSFAGPARLLGAGRWKILHTTGAWYIWFIFSQSYIPRALADSSYVPFAAALVAAAGLRIARARR